MPKYFCCLGNILYDIYGLIDSLSDLINTHPLLEVFLLHMEMEY